MKVIGKYENGNIAVEGLGVRYRVRVEDATVVVGNLDLYRVTDNGTVVNLKARRAKVLGQVADNVLTALEMAKAV